jgi:hypothetical protein
MPDNASEETFNHLLKVISVSEEGRSKRTPSADCTKLLLALTSLKSRCACLMHWQYRFAKDAFLLNEIMCCSPFAFGPGDLRNEAINVAMRLFLRHELECGGTGALRGMYLSFPEYDPSPNAGWIGRHQGINIQPIVDCLFRNVLFWMEFAQA